LKCRAFKNLWKYFRFLSEIAGKQPNALSRQGKVLMQVAWRIVAISRIVPPL